MYSGVYMDDTLSTFVTKEGKCTYNLIVQECDSKNCPEHNQQKTQAVNNEVLPSESEDIKNLNHRLTKLEKELLSEKLQNRVLNSTIAQYGLALKKAEKALWMQHKNATWLLEKLEQIQKQFTQQENKNNDLEEKLGGVMLNVGEVMNLVEKKLPKGNVCEKEIPIQSPSGIKSCGISENVTYFKGR